MHVQVYHGKLATLKPAAIDANLHLPLMLTYTTLALGLRARRCVARCMQSFVHTYKIERVLPYASSTVRVPMVDIMICAQ